MAWTPRFEYCRGCGHYGLCRGCWGCKKFFVYDYPSMDRLCGGQHHTSGPVTIPPGYSNSSVQGNNVSRNQLFK